MYGEPFQNPPNLSHSLLRLLPVMRATRWLEGCDGHDKSRHVKPQSAFRISQPLLFRRFASPVYLPRDLLHHHYRLTMHLALALVAVVGHLPPGCFGTSTAKNFRSPFLRSSAITPPCSAREDTGGSPSTLPDNPLRRSRRTATRSCGYVVPLGRATHSSVVVLLSERLHCWSVWMQTARRRRQHIHIGLPLLVYL